MDIDEKAIIVLGHSHDSGDFDVLVELTSHSNPRFRQLALSALIRRDPARALKTWEKLTTDEDWHVRRRAAELGIEIGVDSIDGLLRLMRDIIILVRETACYATGEIFENAGETLSVDGSMHETGSQSAFSASDPSAGIYNDAINELLICAKDEDSLVRESAIASLGNIGDDRAREIVVAACSDKAPIRRRAVVALAAFEGDDVDAALDAALLDHDWQVRQAAEDISGKKSPKE